MKRDGGPPRITGGELRGRIVQVPQTGDVRPMLGRTRQALFNVLGNEVSGTVWDCFGGSGLLTFEALSRGASGAVIIESDALHASVIQQNVAELRAVDRCLLLRGNTFQVVRPGNDLPRTPAALVFLDPPHAMARDHSSAFWPWLRGLPQTGLLSPDTVIVFGHPARFDTGDTGALQVRQRREYGTVAFTLLGT